MSQVLNSAIKHLFFYNPKDDSELYNLTTYTSLSNTKNDDITQTTTILQAKKICTQLINEKLYIATHNVRGLLRLKKVQC
ncbi:4183_t:CDS:2 [Gigaspora margarita]|uniref:4183_t:CDS:1 n=1 Tax=Gigaspora margarita TaxID=4874 RepID=A0ABN7V7V4_GIGMA|nr:4183_t:CDS:2 [Gigaspora margarita]